MTKPDKEVVVPDVTGKQFLEVYNGLVRKGLTPEVHFYYAMDITNGEVLNQHPKQGTIVSEGSKVKLTVSRSNLIVEVPNLIGLELPSAKNKLRSMHRYERTISIATGVISYIPSKKSADNIVIDQSPRPGEKITPDVKINLLVSAGDLETDPKMPKVTGQSMELCYDLLLSKGVTVDVSTVKTLKPEESGIIVQQSPGEGEALKKGDRVSLKVNLFEMKDRTYSSYEFLSFKVPDDEKEGLFEAYVEDNSPKRIRFSGRMKPGQTISVLFHRRGNARVNILRDKKVIKVYTIEGDDFN